MMLEQIMRRRNNSLLSVLFLMPFWACQMGEDSASLNKKSTGERDSLYPIQLFRLLSKVPRAQLVSKNQPEDDREELLPSEEERQTITITDISVPADQSVTEGSQSEDLFTVTVTYTGVLESIEVYEAGVISSNLEVDNSEWNGSTVYNSNCSD